MNDKQRQTEVLLKKYKAKFDTAFTDNFPNRVIYAEDYSLDAHTDRENNNECVFFFLYKIKKNDLDSIVWNIKRKSLKVYKSKDTCLLAINRFETDSTMNYLKDMVITDSSLINKECYEGLLPIPRFWDYKYPSSTSLIKLDSTFNVYVLESKPGRRFSVYDLKPDIQMPDKWKNGYSKGVAISNKKRTVIYWSVMW